MGAWIETPHNVRQWRQKKVAPRVGAWIETRIADRPSAPRFVAPRVGAWIETVVVSCAIGLRRSRPAWARGLKLLLLLRRNKCRSSRPAWARGLKHVPLACSYALTQVAPRVGAWIETFIRYVWRGILPSRPAWARGLKRRDNPALTPRPLSRPAWARGLKPQKYCLFLRPPTVAPRVGAWIETLPVPASGLSIGRAPRGRVD